MVGIFNMKITQLSISNFRSFEQTPNLELGQINVLVGKNNAGKSSVLYAIGVLQGLTYLHLLNLNIRNKNQPSEIKIELDSLPYTISINEMPSNFSMMSPVVKIVRSGEEITNLNLGDQFLVPFLSQRQMRNVSEDVKKDSLKSMPVDWSNLTARLSQISHPDFPGHDSYKKSCGDILGFYVGVFPSQNGQKPGVYLPDGSDLSVEQMGSGVFHIVDLLIKLSVSKNKIFLIEEPENDLHPQALKALLALIIESSKYNQFVISTHSNIVVQYLCAEQDSRLFEVRVKDAKQQLSEISEVEATPEARLRVLEDLGYSLSDTAPYLWDAWLILEESSAETIIRNYLIPWFCPKLARLKTFSAQGTGNVEKTFSDLQRLITFAHLEPTYKNKTWVIVDGDESGQTAIKTIKEKFKDWDAEKFQTFTAENFENYYPERFAEKAKAALSAPDDANAKKGTAKRAAKAALLKEVTAWLADNPDAGKAELAKSAKEVIEKLKQIESTLA
jgi:predicted ATP-dependent endonuclease of OLD family